MSRRWIAGALFGLLIAVILGLGLSAHFFGVSAYIITGGSMTGSISRGSVAIDKTVPVSALHVGDVITFRPPNSTGNVTHRIIDIQKDDAGNPVFSTKGDFNQSADPWHFTLDKPVQAKYVFHIPWVGYALASFTLRAVRTGLLVVVALVIIGLTVSWMRKRPEGDGQEREGAVKTPALPEGGEKP